MKRNSLKVASLILFVSYLVKSVQPTGDSKNLHKESSNSVSVSLPSQNSNWDESFDSSYVDKLGIRVYTKTKASHEAELKRHGY